MGKPMEKSLPNNIYQYFKTSTMTGVASTLDEDGYPRGAPMSLFYARDEKTLLMASQNRSQTFNNAIREGKIALTFVGGGDVAFSIRGQVRMLKEKMEASEHMGVLVVDIDGVKSDVAVDAEVTEGIKIQFRSEKWQRFFEGVLKELQSCGI
ncbi:MAG: pyridoxamine 5'-phosphate oxidase family protein [Firmicutes bacterium]|nr:pyridoxamine 5'-phosphate oxidase family protein [Bacillota bacterium]